MRALPFIATFLAGTLFASFAAIAWQDPTDDPPEENVAAPVNVGSSEQLKEGVLGLDGLAVFGNTLLAEDSYLNFGATAGTSGYGLRDNAGTLEFKNSGGSWQSFATLVTTYLTLGGITSGEDGVEEIGFADGTTQDTAGGGGQYLESPELTFSNSIRNSWSHGQDSPPDYFGSKIICTGACGGGYAAGDEVWIGGSMDGHEQAAGADDDELWHSFRNYVTIPVKSGGSYVQVSPSDWKLVVWGVWH